MSEIELRQSDREQVLNLFDCKIITTVDVSGKYQTFADEACSRALSEMHRNYPNGVYKDQCRGQEFREQSKIITDKIVGELLRDFGDSDKAKIVVALPWRAGLAFVSSFREAGITKFYHFDIQRDEKTAKPIFATENGDVSDDSIVIIADPMLATGGSAITAINKLQSKGVLKNNIIMMSVVSAPVGVAKILSFGARVITAFLHKKLDNKAYIVPGLGDYGDKYFDEMSEEELKRFIIEIVGLSLEEETGQKLLSRFVRHFA